jgi:hypothetical protein
VFGYPKTAATFQDRGQARDDPSATVTVQHFARYGPGERPVVAPLVRVTLDDPGAHAPSLFEALEAAWEIVKGVAPIHFGFRMPPLPGLGMPQVMLRQARDAVAISEDRVSQASSQEVLLVTPTPVAIRDVGVLRSPAVVEIAPSASHPIMETLGLGVSQVAELGFWVEQDFEVGAAVRLA